MPTPRLPTCALLQMHPFCSLFPLTGAIFPQAAFPAVSTPHSERGCWLLVTWALAGVSVGLGTSLDCWTPLQGFRPLFCVFAATFSSSFPVLCLVSPTQPLAPGSVLLLLWNRLVERPQDLKAGLSGREGGVRRKQRSGKYFPLTSPRSE